MKIEKGFIVGEDWHTHKQVRVGIHAILKIVENVGSSPPADRIHFIDGHITPVDLKREKAA